MLIFKRILLGAIAAVIAIPGAFLLGVWRLWRGTYHGLGGAALHRPQQPEMPELTHRQEEVTLPGGAVVSRRVKRNRARAGR